jgi:hypothetical protein
MPGFLPFFFLIAGFVFPVPALASDPYAGKFTAIEGETDTKQVKIIRVGRNGYFVNAKVGDAVFVGDTVKTDEGVKTELSLSDNSVITIAPGSVMQMKGYYLSQSQVKRNYVVKVLKGTMRFVISKMLTIASTGALKRWVDSNVAVETTTATCGVRGTEFTASVGQIVEAAADGEVHGDIGDEIAVLDGVVTASSSDISIKGSVTASAGLVMIIKRGSVPSEPFPLTPERRGQLLRATTIGKNGNHNGHKPAAKKRIPKYTKGDAARDLASGLPLKDVIDTAFGRGMPVEDIIACIQEIGYNPYTLVYTAIVEGYPAVQVVEAAITNGAPLRMVISAAINAGADTKSVITGASDAGAPPSSIADAVAAVTSPDAPVYGSVLDSGTPSQGIPSGDTAPLVGGGGGATPSGSTYKPN